MSCPPPPPPSPPRGFVASFARLSFLGLSPSIKLQCGAEMEGRLGGSVALHREQARAAWIIRFRQLTLITTDSSKI